MLIHIIMPRKDPSAGICVYCGGGFSEALKFTGFLHAVQEEMRSNLALIALLGLISVSLPFVHASYGDYEPAFLACLDDCRQRECSTPPHLPLTLRITFWSCNDNCKYTCMHQITQQKIASGEEIEQYYGKWPFTRFCGLQEPASVIFSIFNGYMHYRGLVHIANTMPPCYPLKMYHQLYAILNIHAWIWSTVFHARDFPWTERMDYYAAASIVLYAFYVAVVRVFRLYQRKRRRMWAIWTGLCCLAFVGHVGYLASLQRFDYTYNVIVCAVVGGLSNILWVGFWIANRKSRPYAYRIALLAILITLFMSLELFDFPPIWGIFDAHSLWHGSTVLLVWGWYEFVKRDVEWEAEEMKDRVGRRL